MDDVRVGALVRAVRQRMGLRQSDVAAAARVSQKTVSLIESGRLNEVTVRTLRIVLEPLRIRLGFLALWQGGEADRLLDASHAALVDACARVLRRHGWEVIVELTFSRYGERGSIDLVGWHPGTRALLVIEVKSRILDVQATLAGLDRKARLAPQLVRDRGWRPVMTARLLVVADTKANRSVVARHEALFASVLPLRSRAIRSWVRRPAGSIAGVWFLATSTRVTGRRSSVPRQRVRPPRSRSAGAPTGDAAGPSAV